MSKRSIILIIAFVTTYISLVAAPTIVTTVNSKKVGVNDLLIVTYSFRGLSGLQSIRIPENFGPFYNVGRQQSMTNNDLDYIITLQPTKPGRYTIPGATAVAKGVTYQTNAVTIEVVPGSILKQNQQRATPRGRDNIDDEIARMQEMMRQMMGLDEDFEQDIEKMMRERQRRMEEMYRRQRAGGGDIGKLSDNLFVKATVDKTKVYQGESININYKIYNRAGFENGSITKLPELKGFYSKDYDIPMPPQEKIESLNGREYSTFLVKKAQLFPTKQGTLVIDPMEFSAYSNYYGQVKLASSPITIQVLPIPDADPSIGYTGGIGRFTISQSIDKPQMTTDDIATLTISIKGIGNLDLIKPPEVPFPGEISAEAAVATSNNAASQQTEQTKEFKIQFSAIKAGTYTIPSYTFSYFDIEQGKFITINTETISITVSEGKLKPTEKNKEKKRLLPIADIDKNPLQMGNTPTELPKLWWYWTIVTLLLATTPIVNIYGTNRAQQDSPVDNKRLIHTDKIAQGRLKQARSLIHQEDKKPFYDEISKAVTLYISDSLGIHMSEISKDSIKNAMAQHSIVPAIIEETLHIIRECELALYSPIGSMEDRNQILTSATNVIKSVADTVIKSKKSVTKDVV